MERKINYMLASWSGPRRLKALPQNFLEYHINHLNKLKHNLAQITIGFPHNPNVNPEYHRYIQSLKNLDDGTPIKVCPMPNKGMSYGQYSNMFNKYRGEFTHYILIEDDYVPYVDNFDQILADKFDILHEEENCGFLCNLVLDNSGMFDQKCLYKHAAISNGITSDNALSDVWEECGSLPHNVIFNGDIPMQQEQITFSQGFLRAEYEIHDLLPEYRGLYYQSDEDIMRIYGNSFEDLFVPMQFLDPHPTWQILKVPIKIKKNRIFRNRGPRCIS